MGCFTGSNILRYFNVKLKLNVRQKGQDDVMRCFEAARAENYDIFAVRKPRKKKIQCLTGSDAKKNLDKFQQGSGCRNGLGRQKSFDIYLVPGRAISGEYFLNQECKFVRYKRVQFSSAFVYHLISKEPRELLNGC